MLLKEMNDEQLISFKNKAKQNFKAFKARGVKLDMSRGKPSAEQLDLSMGILDAVVSTSDYKASDGTDCRNYGLLDGIPEAKDLFAKLLGVSNKEVIVAGNSSLNIMYDIIIKAMLFGVLGSVMPWSREKIKFIAPCPGYDRHFLICEKLGIEMISVPIYSNGPDMDMIEKLVAADSSIKGIWCVPMYSNPDGITYSDNVVRRFANLKTAAKDFRIFWDNAYFIHHIGDTGDKLLNILDECKKVGNEEKVLMFASMAKITFAGGGISAVVASEKNVAYMKSQLSIQTIGFDKLNQLRHVRYLGDCNGVYAHMEKQRQIIAPKFVKVLEYLNRELAPLGIAEWNNPNGGYFVSVNTMDGCAKRVVALCKEAGVVLTGAGATFPYGIDPRDRNIRIAPTYPPVDELEVAMELFCICVKLASAENIIHSAGGVAI